MAIPNPRAARRGARTTVTAPRRTLPQAQVARLRQEAREQYQRARRLASIELERTEVWSAKQAIIESLSRLGDGGMLGVRALDRANSELFSAWFLLGVDARALGRLPCAGPNESEPDVWRRLMIEHGMSATEATRVAGGHAEHVKAAELGDRERRAAARTAERRRDEVSARLRTLRAALDEPPIRSGSIEITISKEPIEREIAELQQIAQALGPRRRSGRKRET